METQLDQYLSDGGCVLDNPTVDKLFTFQDMENNRDAMAGALYINRYISSPFSTA